MGFSTKASLQFLSLFVMVMHKSPLAFTCLRTNTGIAFAAIEVFRGECNRNHIGITVIDCNNRRHDLNYKSKRQNKLMFIKKKINNLYTVSKVDIYLLGSHNKKTCIITQVAVISGTQYHHVDCSQGRDYCLKSGDRINMGVVNVECLETRGLCQNGGYVKTLKIPIRKCKITVQPRHLCIEVRNTQAVVRSTFRTIPTTDTPFRSTSRDILSKSTFPGFRKTSSGSISKTLTDICYPLVKAAVKKAQCPLPDYAYALICIGVAGVIGATGFFLGYICSKRRSKSQGMAIIPNPPNSQGNPTIQNPPINQSTPANQTPPAKDVNFKKKPEKRVSALSEKRDSTYDTQTDDVEEKSTSVYDSSIATHGTKKSERSKSRQRKK